MNTLSLQEQVLEDIRTNRGGVSTIRAALGAADTQDLPLVVDAVIDQLTSRIHLLITQSEDPTIPEVQQQAYIKAAEDLSAPLHNLQAGKAAFIPTNAYSRHGVTVPALLQKA